MPANFPRGLFQSEADKCFGICMLINPCQRLSLSKYKMRMFQIYLPTWIAFSRQNLRRLVFLVVNFLKTTNKVSSRSPAATCKYRISEKIRKITKMHIQKQRKLSYT
jgi:hypothetical protein